MHYRAQSPSHRNLISAPGESHLNGRTTVITTQCAIKRWPHTIGLESNIHHEVIPGDFNICLLHPGWPIWAGQYGKGSFRQLPHLLGENRNQRATNASARH